MKFLIFDERLSKARPQAGCLRRFFIVGGELEIGNDSSQAYQYFLSGTELRKRSPQRAAPATVRVGPRPRPGPWPETVTTGRTGGGSVTVFAITVTLR